MKNLKLIYNLGKFLLEKSTTRMISLIGKGLKIYNINKICRLVQKCQKNSF